jgi:hypothetical protein
MRRSEEERRNNNMSKSKKPPVDRAVATTKQATVTDAQKVSVTHSLAQGMAQSPGWASAPAVQAAVKAWSAEADAIAATAATIASLRAQLKAAEATQAGNRRDWGTAKSQVMIAVTVACGGSADRVKAFTLDVVSHGRHGALEAPIDLTVKAGTVLGASALAWAKGVAIHGWVVQHAADPTNAATLSALIPCTRPKLTLGGLTPGGSVSARVAAIDPTSPNGMSPWSAWASGSVR